MDAVPGVLNVASTSTSSACQAVPFHHCWSAVLRKARRTLVTERSSVAVPAMVTGAAVRAWPAVGVSTTASGSAASVTGGSQSGFVL